MVVRIKSKKGQTKRTYRSDPQCGSSTEVQQLMIGLHITVLAVVQMIGCNKETQDCMISFERPMYISEQENGRHETLKTIISIIV